MDIRAILYPSALICLLFGVIILVGIGFSYLWLAAMHQQLSKCPHCQRRGAGDLTETVVISSENHMDYKRYPPTRVTVKTLEDHYKCQHCGHQWTRTMKETTRNQVKL
jgi:hypothetical protein